jgi:adenosylhomocysteine nucleosidase
MADRSPFNLALELYCALSTSTNVAPRVEMLTGTKKNIRAFNMSWGIFGAVEEEIRMVVDHLENVFETRWNQQPIFTGKINNQRAVVSPVGVGKARAAASAQYLIDHYSIQKVFLIGAAGALNPELKVGDVVIGQKSVQHDFDTGGKGALEEMKTPWFESDPVLTEAALQTGEEIGLKDRTRIGIILTGDQTIISSQKKAWLWNTFHGDCVEMEGAAIAHVCARNEVPFCLIRVITDFADENARTDFRRTFSELVQIPARIVLTLLGQMEIRAINERNLYTRLRRFLKRQSGSYLKAFRK